MDLCFPSSQQNAHFTYYVWNIKLVASRYPQYLFSVSGPPSLFNGQNNSAQTPVLLKQHRGWRVRGRDAGSPFWHRIQLLSWPPCSRWRCDSAKI